MIEDKMQADRKRRRLDSDMSSKSGVSMMTQMSELSDETQRQGNSVASGLNVNASGIIVYDQTELKTVNEMAFKCHKENGQRTKSRRPWNEARKTRSDEKLKNRSRSVTFTTGDEDENEATVCPTPRPRPANQRMRRATESEIQSYRISEENLQKYDNNTTLKHVCCNRNRNRMHPSIAASGAVSFDCLSEICPLNEPNEEHYTLLHNSQTVPLFPPSSPTSDSGMQSHQSSASSTPPRVEVDGYLHVKPNSRCCSFPKVYVLLIMNVILILINIIGLPFLYYSMTLVSPSTSPSTAAIAEVEPKPCFPCEEFENVLLIDYHLLQSFRAQDGSCCIDSMEKLTETLKSVVVEYDKSLKNKFTEIRGKDYKHEDQAGRQAIKRVVWKLDESVTKSTQDSSGDSSYYSIQRAGFYFIYSRVYFTRDPTDKPGQTVPINYSLKVSSQDSKNIAKVVHEASETWLPSNSTMKHSIGAESIRHFQENDQLFIEIPASSHKYLTSEYFHKMGVIFLST